LLWYLFWHRMDGGERFLSVPDTYSGLPKKGLELLGLVLLLGAIMYALNAQDWLAAQAQGLIPATLPLLGLFLLVALITSFSTEVFSNTVVQLALFVVLLPLALANDFPPAQTLLVVTLSCTCAFMSPIATPVNALAFGGVQGVSLSRMLSIGALMNTVAAIAISVYVLHFVQLGGA
jgi:sodium-dependent dicarboxylate transporter 2/3/5